MITAIASTVLKGAASEGIHDASARGNALVVKAILTANASAVNLKNDAGDTPLHLACIRGHIDVVKVLIAAGADTNAKTPDGWSPLHWAAFKGYMEIAGILIKNKADLNATNKDRWTPLHVAAFAGELEMTRLLIESGGDRNARDRDGFTPLQVASEKWRMVMDLLGGKLPENENPDSLRKQAAALDKEVAGLRKAVLDLEKCKLRAVELEKQLKETVSTRNGIEKKLRAELSAAVDDARAAGRKVAKSDTEKEALSRKQASEVSALTLRCKVAEERVVKEAESAMVARHDAENVLAQNAKQIDAVQKRITQLELDLKRAEALRDENSRVMRACEVRLELAKAESDSLKIRIRAAAGWDEMLREQKRLNDSNAAEILALRERNRELEQGLEAVRQGKTRRAPDLEVRCRELESWVKERDAQIGRLRDELDIERQRTIRLESVE